MASARPIKREKEGWLGVLLTALGCAAFLVWWFWPGGDDVNINMGIRHATPENLLAAALEAGKTVDHGALDEEVLVLALQAIEAGDESLAAQAETAINDDNLRELVERVARFQTTEAPDPQDSATDELDALLEEGKVDAGLDWAVGLDGVAKLEAMATIAGFLTQSGEIDRARALVTERFESLPADAVAPRLRLASLYGQWGDFGAAETVLKDAAAAASTTAGRLQVAKQCYSLNLFDEGERLMELAAKEVEKNPALAREVATVYLEFGETGKARAVAARAEEFQNDGDEGALLALQLALAGWEGDALGKALTQWRKLTGDSIKTRAAGAVREYVGGQLAAAEAPALIWKPVVAGRTTSDFQRRVLRDAVDAGQPGQAAAEIETWSDSVERARGYVILARLLLWRHTRAGQGAL